DIGKAFPSFTSTEQEYLHRLFTKVGTVFSCAHCLKLCNEACLPFGGPKPNIGIHPKTPCFEAYASTSNRKTPGYLITQFKNIACANTQVASSLHGNIEEELESLCIETQVGTALDTVEQLVEEQALDPLHSDN
ncbi:hypothetical protein TIFTF001_055071, partial [Ficus carica]